MRSIMVMALICWSATALAAEEQKPRIAVSGTGRATTPPDLVTIDYGVRGEGATSDAAVSAMVARRKAIDAGLASLAAVTPTASQVSVAEVRGTACQRTYGQQRLSTGDCAIIGYVATLGMTVRTPAVKQAGTIVGLLGRLEATEPHVSGFALADPKPAQRRAIAAALIDARGRAEAIAAGTGVTLGRLTVASTNGYAGGDDIVVTAQRVAAPPPPPAAAAAADRGRPDAPPDRDPGAGVGDVRDRALSFCWDILVHASEGRGPVRGRLLTGAAPHYQNLPNWAPAFAGVARDGFSSP